MIKILFATLVFSSTIFAQFTDFHPELNWYSIKGGNVEVHFHEGAERTAEVVAKIANEIWEPITSLYEYEPEKVHYVIKDIDDYSNGATYFFDNKIEIWTSALDFDLRGTHHWLRNVISHEFTHLVQIQAAMKASRNLPAFFLQALTYEDERRPDILYGFPNFIASYPLATINIPAWFAEGTAQYMRVEFGYDDWDTHRDMILRSYVLDGNMLTWNQMGVFGKTSLGNESVYNSGFALTRYISQKYGEDKIREITRALGKWKNFTIDQAFVDILGKNGDQIYNEWREYLTYDYRERIKPVLNNRVEGVITGGTGFGNFYPTFSRDGKKYIYISNKTSDYFGPASIYSYDIETKAEKLVVAGVRSTISWVGGENRIVYAKLRDRNPDWVNVHDLYVYDLGTEKETRLTFNMRANQPSVSNDGKWIVFLFQKDGTTNLGMVDIEGKNFKQLTNFRHGEQVYNPRFSNDNSFIIFDFSLHDNRDIMRVNVDGSNYSPVVNSSADERNPVFDSEGRLVYSSDETGIFNIYRLNPETNEKEQLTNVLGGAFNPDISSNGDLIYSGYTSTGFKIFYLGKGGGEVNEGANYIVKESPPLGEWKLKGDLANFNIKRLRNFDDSKTPEYKREKYSGAFSKVSFLPFIRYDNYNPDNNFVEKLKPGLYVSSSDMLNRYAFFAGGSINANLERDLFLTFEYRNKLPLLFDLGLKPEMAVELYNVSRKTNQLLQLEPDTLANGEVRYDFEIPADITYNLFEVDIVAKHQVFAREHNIELRYIFSRYSALISSFVIPSLGLIPATDDTYLIGNNFQLKYNIDAIFPSRDSEINPLGLQFEMQYNYELNKFNNENEYEVEDGLLKPVYNNYNFHRLELNSRYGFGLGKGHALSTQIKGGTILGPEVPDFFDFYLGGLLGMKAYPFYAISGNDILWVNLSYRFPLFRDIDTRIGHLYLDKVFLTLYGDIGNAWNGSFPSLGEFKKGAGAELRVWLNSYYLFPTAVFFNASYGFDQFSRVVRNEVITYGKEWRLYGGILFGFDI
jgi:hypothetical protein